MPLQRVKKEASLRHNRRQNANGISRLHDNNNNHTSIMYSVFLTRLNRFHYTLLLTLYAKSDIGIKTTERYLPTNEPKI